MALPVKGKAVLYTSPVLGCGIIYTGNANGDIFAVDSTERHVIWEANIGKLIFHPAVVGDGRVFVTADKSLFVFDALKGGAPVWTHEFDDYLREPVFNSAVNTLYVTSGNHLFAFSSKGEPLGAFEAPAGEHFPFPPEVKERMLCIGSVPLMDPDHQAAKRHTNIHVIRVGADGNLNLTP